MDWIAVAEWCQETAVQRALEGSREGYDKLLTLWKVAHHMIAFDPARKLSNTAH